MHIFNLSLDDFSPHPKAGLNFESIKWCDKLIEKYPNIKIDLFVPAAYSRLGEKPYYLKDYPEWVESVRLLSDNNYRVNLHGLYHRRSKGDFEWHTGHNSNNNEWESLSYEQASVILSKINEEFVSAGLKFFKVFRPPGWYLGEDAARLLTNNGFSIAGDKKHHIKLGNRVEKLRWLSYNWDLISKVPAGNVFAFGHTSSWTNNYLNENKFNLISNMLSSNNYTFKFIGEL